jgi:hypothetical protein
VILPVVVYEYGTWSPKLREEYMMKAFVRKGAEDNIGSKRGEMVGDWRKLHNEELHNLYLSPDTIRIIKSRRIRCVVNAAGMGRRRNSYRVFGGEARRKETTRKT